MVVAEESYKPPYEEPSDAVLAHYGIKGMRWGKSKGGDSSSSNTSKGSSAEKESTDYANAKKHGERAKTSGTKALSNKELQDVVTRMNLEQQYSKLTDSSKKSSGQDFVKKMMADNAKQLVTQYTQKGIKLGVEYAINAAKNR